MTKHSYSNPSETRFRIGDFTCLILKILRPNQSLPKPSTANRVRYSDFTREEALAFRKKGALLSSVGVMDLAVGRPLPALELALGFEHRALGAFWV